MRSGIYPGSFNPPTIAHLALSDAALRQHALDRVVWSISTTALAKETVDHPRFEHRLDVLERVASEVSWLEIVVTDAQLLVEIAEGFDLLIMGADKWKQINEPHWYGGAGERDAAIAALPSVAVAPRPPHDVPVDVALNVSNAHASVSSSRARAGDVDVMLGPARAFADLSGAWIDPTRYDRWAARND